MRHFFKFTILILTFIGTLELKAQCWGGSQIGGILTPTTAWQSTTIASGRFIAFTANAGTYYTFTFCNAPAVSPGFDSELVLANSSTGGVKDYNNNKCGVDPEITWFCQTSGTYYVLLLANTCAIGADATNKTIAYRMAVPLNDNICNAPYFYSNSCSMNYSTYNTTSSTLSATAAPACGGLTNGDVWFKTKAPSSGKLNIGTQAQGGVTTTGVLAAYKGTSCSSALTYLGCNYVSGSMPQLNLTGLTAGDSIFIRFYSYNNTQVGAFGIGLQDPTPNWCMIGNSAEINGGSNCVNITPNKKSQAGAVWSTTQINLTLPFDYKYSVNLGSNDAGGDGIAFVLQNNAAGLSTVGSAGYNLGIGPLTNTFVAEFDTYDNGTANGDGAPNGVNDHISIDVNGNFASPVAGPIQASSTSINIEDGLLHAVRITWNPTSKVFTIYFDGVSRLTYTNDIVTNVFGGNPLVYWGFTSSTGSAFNDQSFCPGTLPGAPAGNTLPVTLTTFNAIKSNQQVNLSWTTSSEKNSKEFIVERSNNGIDFSSIGSVNAKGNSDQINNYQLVDENPIEGTTFYKIRIVDKDGEYEYSPIQFVDIKNSSDIFHIYPNPSNNSDITIEVTEDATVEIYNMSNVLQHQQFVKKGKSILTVNDKQLTTGIYYALIRTTNEVYFTKIIISN
jgi:hypothetical protein